MHPLTPICHCTETFLGRAPDRTHDLTSKMSAAHRVPCVGRCPDHPRSTLLELVVFRPSAPCPRSKSIFDEAPSSLFVRLLLHRCTAGRLVHGPRAARFVQDQCREGITLPLLQPLFVLLVLPSQVFMCPPSSTDQPVNLVPLFPPVERVCSCSYKYSSSASSSLPISSSSTAVRDPLPPP